MWNQIGEISLHKATQSGSIAMVSELLKNGANVNAAVDEYKNTPLHIIGGIRDFDNQYVIAMLLLDAGGDINAKNMYDKTPLDLATTNTSNHFNGINITFFSE